MSTIVIVIFILGYLAIAFEHNLRVNKAASALITGVLCWTVYFLQADSPEGATESLLHHMSEISSILFFLLGAMTIVELIDRHNGFGILTRQIKSKSKPTLVIIVATLTFFLSALLDNLTTAIVMTSLSVKIFQDKNDRLLFAGMIVIAANSGGAWSPLGDVTTTMLWIGGQITALNIIKQLLLPSMAVCFVPALLLARKFKGQYIVSLPQSEHSAAIKRDGKIVLIAGIALLLFVPAFKVATNLPPFMGMLLALGLMWLITTMLHRKKEPEHAARLTVPGALERIDTPSILFFMGILLAVTALQSFGLLKDAAVLLTNFLHNDYLIGTTLGVLSAVVDNVPLVAAAQGMYDMTAYPTDHQFWEFLALTTGSGGSMIIIGSAAGVAVMGIVEINFMWYIKKISGLAALGFAAGILVFIIQHLF